MDWAGHNLTPRNPTLPLINALKKSGRVGSVFDTMPALQRLMHTSVLAGRNPALDLDAYPRPSVR